mgnify:CR=1 FL=1
MRLKRNDFSFEIDHSLELANIHSHTHNRTEQSLSTDSRLSVCCNDDQSEILKLMHWAFSFQLLMRAFHLIIASWPCVSVLVYKRVREGDRKQNNSFFTFSKHKSVCFIRSISQSNKRKELIQTE